jgi:hypothetical protein
MIQLARRAVFASIVLASSAVLADDLTGADRFLCSTGTVTACTEDGACFKESPAAFNIPQFLEVDLQQKRLSTTKASALNRSTDVMNVQRKDGRVVLQGTQGERAFSIMIVEDTGVLTAAVTADGFSIGVFGACTPMNESK